MPTAYFPKHIISCPSQKCILSRDPPRHRCRPAGPPAPEYPQPFGERLTLRLDLVSLATGDVAAFQDLGLDLARQEMRSFRIVLAAPTA